MILATSYDAECLVAYLTTCNEPLKSALYVKTGYTSQLIIDDDTWDSMPSNVQDVVKARTLGFVDGWESKP